MDHESSSSFFKANYSFRFIPEEVKEMEEKLKPRTTSRPDRLLMRELAGKFSESRARAGTSPAVKPKQVLNWFRYHRYNKSTKKVVAASEAPPPAPRSMTALRADQQPKLTVIGPVRRQDAGSSSTGLFGDPTSYEAKSGSNGAWYDVHDFLSHRLDESGDREVMVHFAGFGPEHDEWINARTSLRQRSIPCNTMECGAVNPRDIVLCYKLGEQSCLYFDAEVDVIERKEHDSRAACDCRFFVRYVHDQSEEYVSLRKLCIRPEKRQAWLELQKETNN